MYYEIMMIIDSFEVYFSDSSDTGPSTALEVRILRGQCKERTEEKKCMNNDVQEINLDKPCLKHIHTHTYIYA